MNTVGVELYSRRGKLNSIFFPDLGALARSRALVGPGARALENECQRRHWHPHRLPTEGAMFESVFLGPIPFYNFQFFGLDDSIGGS